MPDFTPRTLLKDATLGERLRELRGEARLTVAEAAARAGVPVRHLEAIETGRYQDLPGDVYTRNFLKRYARVLQVREAAVLERYQREHAVLKPVERPLPSPLPSTRGLALTVLAKRVGIGAAIAATLLYLGWELAQNLTPPRLELISPPPVSRTEESIVEVRGRTDPEATVSVNGQPLPIALDGTFRQVIALVPGRNTLIVTATKNRGRRYTITREVVSEPPASPEHP